MPTLTLRTETASAFTTKGSALSATEFDNNFIQLKAEIDANADALAAVSAHTQNEDQYLDFGGSNQVSAADLKILLDDIPLPSGGSEFDTLSINSGATAYEISENVYGYMYAEDTSDTTTISVADTPTSINTTLTTDQSNNSSYQGNASFRNDSGQTKLLRVSCILTIFNASAADADIEMVCEVASVQQNGRARSYNLGGSSTKQLQLHWEGIISVGATEVVEFLVINEDSTDDLRTTQVQITYNSVN